MLALGLGVLERLIEKRSVEDELSVQARVRAPHMLRLLDDGPSSLFDRIALIRASERSIDLEFFIFNVDTASRLITQELVRRAEAGVKVRILVDFSAPVWQLKPLFARYLKRKGVEVRYYNTAPIYRVISSQHRSHRKLLIGDGKRAVTGGRNVADEYFGFGTRYNFLDSDVRVEGPIVGSLVASFDLYWKSSLASVPERIDEPLSESELRDAEAILGARSGDAALVKAAGAAVTPAAAAAARAEHACNDLTFVTDHPYHGEKNRRVFHEIVAVLAEAKRVVRVESPYFVIRDGGYEVMRSLGERGVRIEALTNSLAATDAAYTIAVLYPRLKWLARAGLTLRAFRGQRVPDQSGIVHQGAAAGGFGTHAKRAVIDDDTTLIGTYNIDPRSANLNSELMLVCRGGASLAAAVLGSMAARAAVSDLVLESGALRDRGAILGAASAGQLGFFAVSLLFANFFDFLL